METKPGVGGFVRGNKARIKSYQSDAKVERELGRNECKCNDM